MAINPYIMKRGDTLLVSVTFTGADGDAIDLTGSTVSSQIRNSDDILLEQLVCTVSDQNTHKGTAVIGCRDTTQWPPAKYFWDIQMVDAQGAIHSSDTITLTVIKDITHA